MRFNGFRSILAAGVAAIVFTAAVGVTRADEPSGKQPDLKKQVEDALKELEKLDEVPNVPDAARQRVDMLRKQLRQFPQPGGAFISPFPGIGGGRNPFGTRQGRLGVSLQRPTSVLVEQLELPPNQGLVIADVVPDSPAARAGLRQNDILLELAGQPVSSELGTLQKELRDLKADTPYDAVVLRRGKREKIAGIKLAEARPGDEGGVPGLPRIEIRAPAAPGLAGARVRVGAQGGAGQESTSVAITNGEFTIIHHSDPIKATLKGRRDAGGTKVMEIRIEDGATSVSAADVDHVPERYRAMVTRLLDSVK